MQTRLASTLAAGALALCGLTATAIAESEASEEDAGGEAPEREAPAQDGGDDDTSSLVTKAEATHVGIGLRLRNARVPQGLLELFLESVPGGSSEMGFGLEIARRRGDFEVQFGLEYDPISIQDGFWVDKGDTLPLDEPDFVRFDGFGWITAEVSFFNHTELARQFSIRYGGGAGLGIIRGAINKQDARCVTADFDTCAAYGPEEPYDIPPVMLVVNAIVGVQIRPLDNVFINLEGGLRTLPFFGGTVGMYL